jgi:CheY-like chemotaxis protein
MALVLTIEPHEEIRPLYAAVIRGLGHEAVVFESGAIAKPDVLLVEPAYPEPFEAARRLRLAHPDLPIVCASIHEPIREEVQVLRPSTYLLKPFSLVELRDALQLALSHRDLLSD